MIRIAPLILLFFMTCSGAEGIKSIPNNCMKMLKKALEKKQFVKNIPENCQVAGDFLAWHQYQKNPKHNDFNKIMLFIHTHPSWPKLSLLQQRAEEAITAKTPKESIVRWFAQYPPITGVGSTHYISALFNKGDNSNAIKKIKYAWHTQHMTQKQQRFFYQKYRKYLDTEDLETRLYKLSWDNNSKGLYGLKRYLKKDFQHLSQALMGLIKRAGNIDNLVKSVPKKYQNHPLLLFHRIQWRLRHKKYDTALDLMYKAMAEKADRKNPPAWLPIRCKLYRYLLTQKKYKDAYKISQHHMNKDVQAADLEWCSGWLSLRFLNNAQEAYTHFKNFYHMATTPISRAKGCYWTAQAQQKLGNDKGHEDWLKTAGTFPLTFYGQLAQQELYGKITIEFKDTVSEENLEHLWGDYIALLDVLKQGNLSRHAKPFLLHMATTAESPKDQEFCVNAAAKYAPDFTVLVAKFAGRKGMIPLEVTFPILKDHQLPKSLPVDVAILHAIIRQESGFDQYGTSPAGAQGLMQLMPKVAKNVAKRWKIPFKKEHLHSASRMNIQIGTTHMANLLKTFEGDIILSLASYNAGITNVKKWIRDYGDPRKGAHILDWIETIPFKETRSYIYRVLESVAIYESMLNAKSPHAVSELSVSTHGKKTPQTPHCQKH